MPVYNNNFVKSSDFLQIKDKDGKFLRTYDPGFKNTINATSEITLIDGENGCLYYRGIPIEELVEKSDFLEVAYLLINGALPTAE